MQVYTYIHIGKPTFNKSNEHLTKCPFQIQLLHTYVCMYACMYLCMCKYLLVCMHIYIYISIQICVYQQQIPVGVCLPSAFFQFASWWFCFRLSMTRSRLPSIQSAQLNAARIPTLTLRVCVCVCVVLLLSFAHNFLHFSFSKFVFLFLSFLFFWVCKCYANCESSFSGFYQMSTEKFTRL